MNILNGKLVSTEIKNEIKEKIKSYTSSNQRPPSLAIILVGENSASHIYVNNKINSCIAINITPKLFKYDESINENTLIKLLNDLNKDDTIDGIIVQLPLPPHIRQSIIIDSISTSKDVDGFHTLNYGLMAHNNPNGITPATPAGVIELLKRYKIDTFGKHCVVVGRSFIVGSPISILMGLDTYPGNCTVTLTHINTVNLSHHTKQADILIVAVGIPNFINEDMVKEGVIVIDIGINRTVNPSKKSGFEIRGDVDFENVSKKSSYITPVPGGIGPMTIAMLLLNTLQTYENNYIHQLSQFIPLLK